MMENKCEIIEAGIAPATIKRGRHNLLLLQSVKDSADKMATADLRSFNNFLEWLVDQEWKRRHPAEKQEVSDHV